MYHIIIITTNWLPAYKCTNETDLTKLLLEVEPERLHRLEVSFPNLIILRDLCTVVFIVTRIV